MVRHYLHKARGMYVAHLEHKETGSEHKLQIMVGKEACPHCGHVTPKNNLGEFDPNKLHIAEIKQLNEDDRRMSAWASHHKVPIHKARK